MRFGNRLSANGPRLLIFGGVYLIAVVVFLSIYRRWPLGDLLWPFTGIGLAGVLLLGFRALMLIGPLSFAWGLFLYSPEIALGHTLAELLEITISAGLLRQLRFDRTFPRMSDAVKFLLVGAITGPLLGSGLKQLVNFSFNHGNWGLFLGAWWGWFRGDYLGILVFASLLLSWMSSAGKQPFRPARSEAAALIFCFASLALLILYLPLVVPPARISPLLGLLFLFVFWAALRFGLRAATTVAFLTIIVGCIALLRQFSKESPFFADAELRLWSFAQTLPVGGLLMATAIGERTQAYERNRQLAGILEATPDFVGISRPDGKILFLNSSAKSLLAHKTAGEEATIADFQPPEAARKTFEEIIPAAAKNGAWSGESVYLRKGKEEIPVSQVVMVHKSDDGRVEFLSTIARDVSEQRRVENALRAAATGVSEGIGEGFFQILVQHLALALHVKCVFVGALQPGKAKVVKTLAVCADGVLQPNFEYNMVGTPCENIFAIHTCYYSSDVAGLFPQDPLVQQFGINAYMGVPLFTANGENIGLMVAMNDVPPRNRELATSILQIYSTRSATELERLKTEESLRLSEERLRQSQKLEALGNLAGGIAHDFNNILTVIKSCSTLALEGVSGDNPIYEDLREVHEAADRAAELTAHLLAFGRPQMSAPRLFEVNAEISAVLKMLRRVLEENIRFETRLTSESLYINADPNRFDQVIINLAVNARDAMPYGGRFELATHQVSVDRRAAPAVPLDPGEYVLVQVMDTGVGMDQGTLTRIFEPFFTTKPAGRGSGIGLATVYGIMKHVGGHIAVKSKPQEGTTFELYFPIATTAYEGQSEMLAPPFAGGHETVLLVEDDSALRHLIQKILEAAGYTVFAASGVEHAERILHEITGDLALVVTDVVMADGNGPELVARIAQTKPQIKFLFMSGYTAGKVPQKYLTGDHPAFLAKPFEPMELARKVREILDSGQTFATA